MADPDGELPPSVLCRKCQRIFDTPKDILFATDALTSKGTVRHHEDFASLKESVDLGCYICVRLHAAFVNYARSSACLTRNAWFIHVDLVEIGQSRNWDFHLEFQEKIFTVDHSVNVRDVEAIKANVLGHLMKTHFYAFRKTRASEMGLSKALPVGTRSTRSLHQAKAWLEICRTDHDCNFEDQPSEYLPTRLISIDASTPERMSAKLCHGYTLPAGTRYLTLSHRWGSEPNLMLTTRSLSAFLESLPVSMLSRLVQDAIKVTATLGFSYLWIDTLCIVQDDDDDWAREAGSMQQVYQQAFCNLMALDSESEDQGLLFSERATNPNLPSVQPLWKTSETESRRVLLRDYDVSLEVSQDNVERSLPMKARVDTGCFITEADPLDGINARPLFRRAWVLQEQHLARRGLFLGRDQLYWACSKGVVSELWPTEWQSQDDPATESAYSCGHNHPSSFDHPYFHLDLSADTKMTMKEVYHAWRCLLSNYTSRAITKSHDRLFALAGVAKDFRRVLKNQEYRFGLWLDDPVSLLWSQEANIVLSKHSNTDQSLSSWSWAALDKPIEWQYDDYHQPFECDPKRMFARLLREDKDSQLQLKLKGPLLLIDPAILEVRDVTNLGYKAGQPDESEFHYLPDHGTLLFTAETNGAKQKAHSSIYFMPMVRVGVSNTSRVHGAWGLLLTRAAECAPATFKRVGTGILKSITEEWYGVFAQNQMALTADDYMDMEDDGTCTIAVM